MPVNHYSIISIMQHGLYYLELIDKMSWCLIHILSYKNSLFYFFETVDSHGWTPFVTPMDVFFSSLKESLKILSYSTFCKDFAHHISCIPIVSLQTNCFYTQKIIISYFHIMLKWLKCWQFIYYDFNTLKERIYKRF